VPGGTVGVWVIGGCGLLASVLALVVSFVPPAQVEVGSPTTYVGLLIGLAVVFVALPFWAYAARRASWRDESLDFAPFTWQGGAPAGAGLPEWPDGPDGR
jgi:glutamate:GABA antiporter